MRHRRTFGAGAFAVFLLAAGCGGPTLVNTARLPDNHHCQYMKEVCKEARDFESSYSQLSPEEKKDAENILKAYRIQCNDAIEECQRSAKVK